MNDVEELATFEYPNGAVEILSTEHWEGPRDGVRLLRSDPELTGFDIIFLVPAPYVEEMRTDASILLFISTMKAMGQELLNQPGFWKQEN